MSFNLFWTDSFDLFLDVCEFGNLFKSTEATEYT